MPADHTGVSGKGDDAVAQIARLRDQVETLIREKTGTKMDDLAACLEDSTRDTAAALRDRADTLARAIRARPLSALLIAAVAGFVLGRGSR